jgi:type VI secretion system protein
MSGRRLIEMAFVARKAKMVRMTRLFLGIGLITGLLLPLGACTAVGSVAKVVASVTANAFTGPPEPVFLDLKGLLVIADADANLNSAVALDLVFVRDVATLEKLQALPAARWFATRADLQRSFPEALTVRSWELVPRQSVRLSERELGSPRVAGVLLFADYRTPGDHRALLPELRSGALVKLGARGFTVMAHPQ